MHYIHFWGLLPPNGIPPGAKFVLQVLRSPTLAALLHCTRAVGVSQTAAWYKESWNYLTFAPRHFRSRMRKARNGISPAGKFTANGKKTKTDAFDSVSF